MIILGIDPGLATIGYGIIRKSGGSVFKSRHSIITPVEPKIKMDLECLSYGIIKTNASTPTAERLRQINNELNKIMKLYQPKILAIESIFFFRNMKTALPVSQARGVILLTAAKRRLPIYEYTPLQIKKSILDYGWAEKPKMQKKIKALLNLKEIPRPDDAADALGAAICCAWSLQKQEA